MPLLGSLHRRLLLLLLLCAIGAVVLWITAEVTERSTRHEAHTTLQHSLNTHAGSLSSELRRYNQLPDIMAGSAELQRLLLEPYNPEARIMANAWLFRFQMVTGASVAYVLDPAGLTLAASNVEAVDSFVGRNYGFRPYFQEAADGGKGLFVALGVTSNIPGYYAASPVAPRGPLLGVAVVKINLRDLLAPGGYHHRAMLADANGVVFAANDPRLLFRTLQPLPAAVRQGIVDTQQYPGRGLQPLGLIDDGTVDGMPIQRLSLSENGASADPASTDNYFVEARDLPEAGWRLAILLDTGFMTGRMWMNLLIAGLAVALAATLLLVWDQRRRYLRSLLENAIRDPLTRLYTRFYMNEAVRRLLAEHDRGALSGVAMILFDLDRFKDINDTYGHAAGDAVLAEVAVIILNEVRVCDIAVRFGGEELAVFLPATSFAGACAFAERVRQRVAALRLDIGDPPLRLTLSGGVALHKLEQSLSSLIMEADAPLYQAKRQGRNRILPALAGADGSPQSMATAS